MEIDIQLPTYWCSPNFSWLMASDARAAAQSVPGVPEVVIRLLGRHDADKIRRCQPGSCLWRCLRDRRRPRTAQPEGCLWFDWSRSLDDANEYVLVEAFRDDDAAVVHVNSDHFKEAQNDLPPHLSATPKIVNFKVDGEDWSELGEMAVGWPVTTGVCALGPLDERT